MNKPLKQSVQDYLASHTLSEQQLQQLESISAQVKPVKTQNSFKYIVATATVVASLALVLLVTLLISEKDDVQQRIALEVASHHIKLKPLDVETNSIEGIRRYFKTLDFLPVNSSLVNDAGLELIGGRYCSLQGISAAQLRVKKPGSNVVQMLYQAEYRKDVFDNMPQLEEGESPVEVFVKGIKVKIWVEKGLLFVLSDLPES